MKGRRKQKVLIFCLSGLGDMILASPALAALRSEPERFSLTLLTMFASVKEYLLEHEFSKDVRFFDFLHASPIASFAYLWKLRREGFEVCVIPYAMNRLEYNLASRLIGARRRIGFRYQRQRLLNLPWLNHDVIDERTELHVVEENLRWASLLTGRTLGRANAELHYRFSPEASREAEAFLSANGLGNATLVVGIHPGCNSLKNHHRRCWPSNRVVAFIEEMAKRLPQARFILFEGPQDGPFANEILKSTSRAIHAHNLPLRTVGALIGRCSLFVSNDSGLMHLAAACKTPCVAIFGPTNPTWVHPWRTKSTIVSRHLPCSPCFFYSSRPLSCAAGLNYACVTALPVDDVLEASLHLLEKGVRHDAGMSSFPRDSSNPSPHLT